MLPALLLLACAHRPGLPEAAEALPEDALVAPLPVVSAGSEVLPPALADCFLVEHPDPSLARIACRTRLAAVAELAPGEGLAPDTALTLFLAQATSGEPGRFTRGEGQLLLQGASKAVDTWTLEGQPGLEGYAHVDLLADGRTRLVMAGAPRTDPARDLASAMLLEALLEGGAEGIPPRPAGPAFLGRSLGGTEGCLELPAAGGGAVLRCPAGEVRWATNPALLEPGMAASLEQTVAEAALPPPGGAWDRSAPSCTLEGLPARCMLLSHPSSKDGWLLATGAVQGLGVMVQCAWSRSRGLPGPCRDMVEADLGRSPR